MAPVEYAKPKIASSTELMLDEGPSVCYPAASCGVEMGEVRHLGVEEIGLTAGLGPCLGIVLMSAETGEAFLAHLPTPGVGSSEFEELIKWHFLSLEALSKLS